MSSSSIATSVVGVQRPRIELVPPADVSATGEMALEVCRLAGLFLDPWQEWLLANSLGERADGKWSAFEVAQVISRQNGKGSVLEGRELTGLFAIDEERLIIHSAHEQATSSEHQRRLLELIEAVPDFDQQILRAPKGKGMEAIELRNGSRILFKTRTGGGGRGLTGDLIVLDEAMILPEATTAALVPTMAARSINGNPQLWYAGSAVDQEKTEHGVVLARVRDRALKGAPRLMYVEWSGPGDDPSRVPDDVFNDPDVWAQANPGLGLRISLEHVANEAGGALGPREFAVERLGIGDWPNLSRHVAAAGAGLLGGVAAGRVDRVAAADRLRAHRRRRRPRARVAAPDLGLLHDQPNPEMAADELWEIVATHLLLWGNAFLAKVRDSARDRPRAVADPPEPGDGRPSTTAAATSSLDGGAEALPRDRHPPHPRARHRRAGRALADPAGPAGARRRRWRWRSSPAASGRTRRCRRGPHPPEQVPEPGGREAPQGRLQVGHGSGPRRGGLAVLEEGMDYKQTGMPLADAQFIETSTSTSSRSRCCSASRRGCSAPRPATASPTPPRSRRIDFVTHSLRRWLVRIEGSSSATRRSSRRASGSSPSSSIDALLRVVDEGALRVYASRSTRRRAGCTAARSATARTSARGSGRHPQAAAARPPPTQERTSERDDEQD
jgi:hypothetical protein